MTKLNVKMKDAAPNKPSTGGRFKRMVGSIKQILSGILYEHGGGGV